MPTEPLATPAPTPETTPVPGGGSWRWDIALPGWVPNPNPDAAAEPTETPQE